MVVFVVAEPGSGGSVGAVQQWECGGALGLLRCPGTAGGTGSRWSSLRPQQHPQPPALSTVRQHIMTMINQTCLHGSIRMFSIDWSIVQKVCDRFISGMSGVNVSEAQSLRFFCWMTPNYAGLWPFTLDWTGVRLGLKHSSTALCHLLNIFSIVDGEQVICCAKEY